MKHLTLRRPLVFLDLETTGVNPATDRIIEISLVKVHPDGTRDTLTRRVHPGRSIPPASSGIHGITDADVDGAPGFAGAAAEVAAFIGEADLAGFNIQRFDLLVLLRELTLAGVRLEMAGRAVVDAQVIFHRRVPRDLSAAYRLYCGRDLTVQHTAQGDVEACVEVLDAQLGTYPDLPRTPQELHAQFGPRELPSSMQVEPGNVAFLEPTGRLVWNNGEAVVAFGPDGIRGRALRDLAGADRRFLRWVLRKDFHPEVKALVQQALEGRFPTPPGPQGQRAHVVVG